ncbi:hypothetical protein [Lentzea sp. CA-135723]|uniref:hypothetical protein n=1 Tax=Lentzea sp. CA-135723 TaxID=3239950 RepID=UPI003D8DEACA
MDANILTRTRGRRPPWWCTGVAVLSIVVGLLCGLAAAASAQPVTPTPTAPTPPPTTSSSVPATTSPPNVSPQPPPAERAECGITDLSACVNEGFASFLNLLVGESLNWLLQMLGTTLLSTPTLDQLPRLGEIWEQSRLFVVATYSLLVLLAGILVMGHQTVQTRYTIREIAPRVGIGFIAANLSLLVGDQAIRFANAASSAVLGDGLDPQTSGKAVSELFVALVKQSVLDGGLFAGLLSLALAILLIGLLIGYVVRVAFTALLIAGAPLALMCHGLPQLEGVAHWFWRSGAGVLGIQVGQSLALIVALKVFLEPGGFAFFGAPTSDGIINLIVLIALIWILVKIPGWVMKQVGVGGGRRSFLGGLAYAFAFGKAMALVGGGRAAAAGARTAAQSSSGAGRAGPADPPWPTQSPFASTPQMVARRLKESYDAERWRAARRPRVPSQDPKFLQPQPQQTIHDPAVVPATLASALPEFSSASTPDAPVAPPRRGPKPGSSPQFQVAGGPRRRTTAPKVGRPVRVASVPPQLQFRQATPPAPTSPSPKPASVPSTPVFQPAQPEPRFGDAYRRTHSVAPPVFRAPKPQAGEEK